MTASLQPESPDNLRIKNRRKRLANIWKSEEWKRRKQEFIKDKRCAWCGATEKLLPHHPYINSLKDGTYLDLYLSGCIVLCTSCHYALHHGRKLCPICKERYAPFDADMCYTCYQSAHPEIKENIERRKRERQDIQRKLRREAREKYKKTKKAKKSKNG